MDCFVYRISSRVDRVFNNPEEPESEDEDVRLERERTANALTSVESQEVILVKQLTQKCCASLFTVGNRHLCDCFYCPFIQPSLEIVNLPSFLSSSDIMQVSFFIVL